MITGEVAADGRGDAIQAVTRTGSAIHAVCQEADGALWVTARADNDHGVPVTLTVGASDAELRRFVEQPFQLGADPAVRVLLDTQPAGVRLVAVGHHLIVDGMTLDAFVYESLRVVSGLTPREARSIRGSTPSPAVLKGSLAA